MNIIISISIALLFFSCSISYRPQGMAYLRHFKSDSIEIEIPIVVTGHGNLHSMGFSLKKWKDTSSLWIHISRIQKNITADSVALFVNKGYSRQGSLKGDISFIGDSVLIINFRTPRYNGRDEVKRWTKYEYNGSYQFKAIQDR